MELRSAARFKYINDEFLRCYTPNKAPRRSPLINRGYYIRCKLIRTLLAQFVSVHEGKPVQVLSIGAGFDTSYWVLKSENRLDSVHWFETDFGEVVSRKCVMIRSEKMLSSLVVPETPFEGKKKEFILVFTHQASKAMKFTRLITVL